MSRQFRLSWPLLVGAFAFIPALRAPKGVLGDPDTYFHIVVGRWIMAHGALPTVDPFSHSLAGAAWRTHEWLGEVVLALAYQLSGWRAVVLLTASCFAFSAALLTRRLLRQSEPLLAVTLSSGRGRSVPAAPAGAAASPRAAHPHRLLRGSVHRAGPDAGPTLSCAVPDAALGQHSRQLRLRVGARRLSWSRSHRAASAGTPADGRGAAVGGLRAGCGGSHLGNAQRHRRLRFPSFT